MDFKQEQFNDFVRQVMHSGTLFENGQYVISEVQFAWTVWKAAWIAAWKAALSA